MYTWMQTSDLKKFLWMSSERKPHFAPGALLLLIVIHTSIELHLWEFYIHALFYSVVFSVPHSCMAGDLLNRCTFLKGHYCIFSFWNLRILATDWWIGAHDNQSTVAAVSCCPAFLRREELGRLWQFGKRLNFKVTGKQRKNHKIKPHTRFHFPALFAWPAQLDWPASTVCW